MTKKTGPLALAMAAAVLAAAWIPAGAAARATGVVQRSVNDGVYTTAQADRGAKIFGTTCTACHDPARFTGDEFVSTWAGRPLADLFGAVQTMPEDNPGSLKAQEYADVIAFFLELNKFKTGTTELPSDGMRSITMEKPAP